jgi:hypothetical protein
LYFGNVGVQLYENSSHKLIDVEKNTREIVLYFGGIDVVMFFAELE